VLCGRPTNNGRVLNFHCPMHMSQFSAREADYLDMEDTVVNSK